jgi:hypothetical protein
MLGGASLDQDQIAEAQIGLQNPGGLEGTGSNVGQRFAGEATCPRADLETIEVRLPANEDNVCSDLGNPLAELPVDRPLAARRLLHIPEDDNLPLRGKIVQRIECRVNCLQGSLESVQKKEGAASVADWLKPVSSRFQSLKRPEDLSGLEPLDAGHGNGRKDGIDHVATDQPRVEIVSLAVNVQSEASPVGPDLGYVTGPDFVLPPNP